MARLFVAVTPPAPVREVIAGLARPTRAGTRWTRPEQWHVTVRFFGSVSTAAARAALRRLVHPTVTAELGEEIARLGQRVLVVPVGGLDGLATAVRACTADVGEPVDPRPFTGHLTLARVDGDGPGIRGLVGAPVPSAAWVVDHVELTRSERRADGARYDMVERIALGG